MDSESEEIPVESSDESLLDIKELDDLEFDLPQVAAPSLESVLWELESEGSDSASLHSLQSLKTKFRSMLCHKILQGISAQLVSAAERVHAGLPTVITNSLKYVSVGTSHGYVLSFDTEQNLCWCCYDAQCVDQGAVSAMAFNADSSRLLIGYEQGYISMVDATTGDILRRLPDAHAPHSAVLHLRYTHLNSLALCGDSAGCVFSLRFRRSISGRVADSRCLFSGARGEVCTLEPLVHGHLDDRLLDNVLVAMATLSKVIVVALRPRLRVLFTQPLPKMATCLPLVAWQLVAGGGGNGGYKTVLAWGRGHELNYARVAANGGKLRMTPLRSVHVQGYTMAGLCWLGGRHLAVLDTSENLRLIEIRSQREMEVLELASAGLVYGSAHFKALAIGGGVSEAFALAGERACYNSLSGRGDQLLVLGTKAVHLVKLRTWPERLFYLSEQGRWTEALQLAAEEGAAYPDTDELLHSYLDSLDRSRVDKESLTAAVNCCVKLGKIDILCNDLFEALSSDRSTEHCYYSLLTDHITSNHLHSISPAVAQSLVTHLSTTSDTYTLETVLLSLDVTCLDLHQALTLCKQRHLYDAWIHITTTTMGDYAAPLVEFLHELTPTNHRLGNALLVYVSSTLAGFAYPRGRISERDVAKAKHDVLRCLETSHSVGGAVDEPSYPYLRALLEYNARECLNVIGLAFREPEFSGELGMLQRRRLVEILQRIVQQPAFTVPHQVCLACFVAQLIVTGNLLTDRGIVERVFDVLTSCDASALSVRDLGEREQAWLDLLHANILDPAPNWLELAMRAKCYRVAQHLRESHGDYLVFDCFLLDPLRGADIFPYIVKHISDPERRVRQQFHEHFRAIAELDAEATANIVLDHFADEIDLLAEVLDGSIELQFSFLKSVMAGDLKISSTLSEKYLELMCDRSPEGVVAFLRIGTCNTERALEIARRYNHPAACALLLEQSGRWQEALELLLSKEMADQAVELCVRGADHIDSEGEQKLWLTLLKSGRSGSVTLRNLLHAAAPHVPPPLLLDLVRDAHFGDVRTLLQGILTDYNHDIQVLKTTMSILSRDLHGTLAKTLSACGRGVAIDCLDCHVCGRVVGDGRGRVAVWSCGHCFHGDCVEEDVEACPCCGLAGTRVPGVGEGRKRGRSQEVVGRITRPDVEGHF